MSDSKPHDQLHTDIQQCILFFTQNNKPTEQLARLIHEFQHSNLLERHLFTFTKLIRSADFEKVLIFQRSLQVLDESDCEDITNGHVNTNTAKKVVALVNVLSKKGPHGFWYILHALRPNHPVFFNERHGDIKCCGKPNHFHLFSIFTLTIMLWTPKKA